MKRPWLLVAILAFALAATAASPSAKPSPSAPKPGPTPQPGASQTQSDTFTCEATLLRIERLLGNEFALGRANVGDDECETEVGSLLPTIDLGIVKARLLYSETSDETSEGAKQGHAESGVAEVTITLGSTVIEIEVLTAEATAGPCPSRDLSADSVVAGVFIDGAPLLEVPSDGAPFDLNLGTLGFLHLNWEENDGSRITRRAFFLDDNFLVGDVVISEAIADVHGNPCEPDDPDGRKPGFMTGGSWMAEVGSRFDRNGEGEVEPGTRLGLSLSLDCFTTEGVDPHRGRHHLGVRWLDENGNERSNFKLTQLDDAVCTDTPANPNQPRSQFDTMEGTGSGTCRANGMAVDVSIRFRLTDSGEPGRSDRLEVDTDVIGGFELPDGIGDVCDYESAGLADAGNLQAHGPGGRA